MCTTSKVTIPCNKNDGLWTAESSKGWGGEVFKEVQRLGGEEGSLAMEESFHKARQVSESWGWKGENKQTD